MLFVADLLHRAVLEERDVEAFGLHALQQAPEDALEGLREGPRPLEGLGKDEARRWDRNLHQTLEGSFLAVSKPIFGPRYTLFPPLSTQKVPKTLIQHL